MLTMLKNCSMNLKT